MSKAVPWSGEVRTAESPAVKFTPSGDRLLKGASPWSWYMARMPSYLAYPPPAKSPSAAKGPKASTPFENASTMAGRMISCSSRPSSPPSPACGLRAITAMRGSTMPKSSMSERRSVWRSCTIFSLEMLRLISDTGMCLVTSPTRSTSLHRIIMASPSSSAARYSVCPV